MSARTLQCQRRSAIGTSACRKLLRQGLLPGVIYGRKFNAVPIQISSAAFMKLLSAHEGGGGLITIEFDDNGKKEEMPAILQEVQIDPVTRRIRNIDLQRVSLTEKIEVSVPVRLIGEAAGVALGGLLQQVAHELRVECLPTDIPEAIEVDVSALEIGDSISVADLPVRVGMQILASPNDAVVTVTVPKVEEEVTPTEAPAEPELVARKGAEEEEETAEQEAGKEKEQKA